jgi:FlaA1/EpsC-like NDP-sugar epimerase
MSVRPGEKLFEELSTDEEHMARTRHPKIPIGKIGGRTLAEVEGGLALLQASADSPDPSAVRAALRGLVPEMIEPSLPASPPASQDPLPASSIR